MFLNGRRSVVIAVQKGDVEIPEHQLLQEIGAASLQAIKQYISHAHSSCQIDPDLPRLDQRVCAFGYANWPAKLRLERLAAGIGFPKLPEFG
jgi:hypothetical protein